MPQTDGERRETEIIKSAVKVALAEFFDIDPDDRNASREIRDAIADLVEERRDRKNRNKQTHLEIMKAGLSVAAGAGVAWASSYFQWFKR